jgi:hypothetical protein
MRNLRTFIALVGTMAIMAGTVRPAAAADVESQTRRVLGTVVNYVPNVVMDFVDIFKGSVGVGNGSGVDLRFTRLLAAGYSRYDVTRYGLNGRDRPVYEESIYDGGVGVVGFVFGDLVRDPYEIGLTVQIVKGGAEGAINVRSGLDFLCGLAFIDLEGDNVSYF